MMLQEPDNFHAEVCTCMDVRGPHEMMMRFKEWMFDSLQKGEVLTVRGGESGPFWFVFNVLNEDVPKVTKWLRKNGCKVEEWTR